MSLCTSDSIDCCSLKRAKEFILTCGERLPDGVAEAPPPSDDVEDGRIVRHRGPQPEHHEQARLADQSGSHDEGALEVVREQVDGEGAHAVGGAQAQQREGHRSNAQGAADVSLEEIIQFKDM